MPKNDKRIKVTPLALLAGEGDLHALVACHGPVLSGRPFEGARRLLEDLDDSAGADGAATFTDREP